MGASNEIKPGTAEFYLALKLLDESTYNGSVNVPEFLKKIKSSNERELSVYSTKEGEAKLAKDLDKVLARYGVKSGGGDLGVIVIPGMPPVVPGSEPVIYSRLDAESHSSYGLVAGPRN